MTNLTDQEIDWKQESRRFDAVASLYDAYRPGYPEQMIEYILAATAIPQHGRILEIGSGTGIATLLFARRGFSLTCIDPGENLVAIARRKLQGFPQVDFVVTDFEDWNGPQGAYNLVISAQAFHWIPKEIGFAKAARALKPGGCIALFWNMSPDLQGEIFDDLNKVYQACAPDLVMKKRDSYEYLVRQRERELAGSGYFIGVEVKMFPWSAKYTTGQYLGLLNTYSDHLRLPEETRDRLFAGIADVINMYGGTLEKPYIAVAYTGCKAS